MADIADMSPAAKANLDQLLATAGADVDRFVSAVKAGIDANGREQTIMDFMALFQKRYQPFAVAAIAAIALARLADR